ASTVVRVAQNDYNHLGQKIDQILNCVPADCTGAPSADTNVKTIWALDSSGLVISEISPRQCVSPSPDPCLRSDGAAPVADTSYLTTGYAYDVLGHLMTVAEDPAHVNVT